MYHIRIEFMPRSPSHDETNPTLGTFVYNAMIISEYSARLLFLSHSPMLRFLTLANAGIRDYDERAFVLLKKMQHVINICS